MSEIATNPTIAHSCMENSASFDLKNDIETPSPQNSSNSDFKPQLLNISIDEIFFNARLGSECIQDISPQSLKENVEDNPVFDAMLEQKIIPKIKPADSPGESHSSILNNVFNNNTPQPSLGDFTLNAEEHSFSSLEENRKAVLQPIVYDNAKNYSYNQKELNQTRLYHSQQFQRIQHPFEPQVSSLHQFTMYNQVLSPNVFKELRPNGNRKYSNAFQSILNGFQPHTNNGQSFTNDRQTYLNAHDMQTSVAQFNSKGIQSSLIDTDVSQSYLRNNHSLQSDLYQHQKDTSVQLNTSQSSPSSSNLQPYPAFSSACPKQLTIVKSSLDGNQQLFDNYPSQSSSTSLNLQPNRCKPFQAQSNANKPSLNFNQLPSDNLENGKTTFIDVIAPLEKYFRADTCLLCGFKSSAKWPCSARKHLVTHLHRKDFKCSICGKGFVTPEYQLAHEKTHAKDPTFQCSVCKTKFRTWRRLTMHEKTHEGIKHQCPICNMQLATQVLLKRHLTIHTGELPYQCSMCLERFRTTSSLRLHMSHHTGEKRFTCDICGKGFNGRDLYKQHLGTHEGGTAFECDKCDKTFNFKSNLSQHRKTHSEDRKHECLKCGKKFKFPHHLRSHVNTHGPIIKTE